MKACPACGRLYPPEAGFCPVDGNQLSSATKVPVVTDTKDPRIGQMVRERYQVRRVVANGGMGRVYEALDLVERRSVALKILHPEVANDEVSVERFKREFEVSAQLPHDHIVEVLDFQPTADGSFVIVMEFLYGEELRNTLKREQVLPPERVIRMLSQLALSLDRAHERKLVHRDLKPDNLFLCQTREGDNVKILDFGSVKDRGLEAKKLTVLGTTIGSPYYMAPEQAQGLDTLDHRADVWALAAITYESICGRVPFKGNNGPSILLEILTKEAVPPSRAGAGKKYPVPPTVDRVLAHAFKKAPGLRIESVGALADAIGHAYGLEGSHGEWAETPQEELGHRIARKLPQLMAQEPTAIAAANTTLDSFFGEKDALIEVDPRVEAPPAAPAEQPQRAPVIGGTPGYTAQGYEMTAPLETRGQAYAGWADSEAPMSVPKSGFGWLVAIAVGAVALVLGIVVVLVVMR